MLLSSAYKTKSFLGPQNFTGEKNNQSYMSVEGVVRLAQQYPVRKSWLIHVVVWQKSAQHCKTINLQLKINKKKKTAKIEL